MFYFQVSSVAVLSSGEHKYLQLEASVAVLSSGGTLTYYCIITGNSLL